MSESYQAAFFIIPARILNLPHLTLSYLKIYETIFQFWNHGKNCYLSDLAIMERTGIKSDGTLRKAFLYFEKHGELIRSTENGQRYFVQPSAKISTGRDVTVPRGTVDRSRRNGTTVPGGTHNIKKINKKKLRESAPSILNKKKRSYCPGILELVISDEAKEIAKNKKLDLDDLFSSFSAYAQSTGWLREDWRAAFLKWVNDEKIKKCADYLMNEPKSTVKEYGPGHEAWEAKQAWERKHGRSPNETTSH